MRASSYAKRWAAKEACAKALGLGIPIAAVGMDSSFAGGGSVQEALILAGFVVAGIVLLFAAGFLCRRHGHAPHAARYAVAHRS